MDVGCCEVEVMVGTVGVIAIMRSIFVAGDCRFRGSRRFWVDNSDDPTSPGTGTVGTAGTVGFGES